MFIIEGKQGEEELVRNLSNNTNSISFSYGVNSLPLDVMTIDSDKIFFFDYIGWLYHYYIENYTFRENKKHDYLIIYTNQDRGSIEIYRDMLENYEKRLGIPIVITCKEQIDMARRIDIGDIVRDKNSDGLYMVCKLMGVTLETGEVINNYPYTLIRVTSGVETHSFSELHYIEDEYELVLKNKDIDLVIKQ